MTTPPPATPAKPNAVLAYLAKNWHWVAIAVAANIVGAVLHI